MVTGDAELDLSAPQHVGDVTDADLLIVADVEDLPRMLGRQDGRLYSVVDVTEGASGGRIVHGGAVDKLGDHEPAGLSGAVDVVVADDNRSSVTVTDQSFTCEFG